MTNIRNGRGNITTDSTDIKKIIKECYEWLYANKFDTLDECKNPLKVTKYQTHSRINRSFESLYSY